MKYDVNDLTNKQLSILIAEAKGYMYVEYDEYISGYLADTGSSFDEGVWVIYDPTTNWDQAGELLENYKPYISPMPQGATMVEILDHVSSVKSKQGIEYATAKHPDSIMIALCRAVVAYHYGYGIEM